MTPAPYYIPPPTYAPQTQRPIPTEAPTPPTRRPHDLALKLDQQHSNLRIGESTEVECYSSDNSYSDVIWERADGQPLPLNIQVSELMKNFIRSYFKIFPVITNSDSRKKKGLVEGLL